MIKRFNLFLYLIIGITLVIVFYEFKNYMSIKEMFPFSSEQQSDDSSSSEESSATWNSQFSIGQQSDDSSSSKDSSATWNKNKILNKKFNKKINKKFNKKFSKKLNRRNRSESPLSNRKLGIINSHNKIHPENKNIYALFSKQLNFQEENQKYLQKLLQKLK
jgi:hypothetical protein